MENTDRNKTKPSVSAVEDRTLEASSRPGLGVQTPWEASTAPFRWKMILENMTEHPFFNLARLGARLECRD